VAVGGRLAQQGQRAREKKLRVELEVQPPPTSHIFDPCPVNPNDLSTIPQHIDISHTLLYFTSCAHCLDPIQKAAVAPWPL